MAQQPDYILTRRGLAIKKNVFTDKELQKHKKNLTVRPFTAGDFGPPPKPFPIWQESKTRFYVPRHYGLEHFPAPQLEHLTKGIECPHLKFNGDLRDKQKPAVKSFLKTLGILGETDMISNGGLLNLPCGFGKTCIAIWLIAKLKIKTLVVVHKEFLVHQWQERIQQFLPNARIGRIQGKTIDIENKDIVIGMLQSLSTKEYDKQLFDQFGFTIVDECHHIAAEVFSRALPLICSYYTLGLSATPKRKDGLSKVFHWYLGPSLYEVTRKGEDKVKIHAIHYSHPSKEYSKELIGAFGRINTAGMLNNICAFGRRLDLVIEIIKYAVSLDKKILVLSDRRAHLDSMQQQIEQQQIGTVGQYIGYTGKQKKEKLEHAASCQIVLGTYAMASEGMDIPTLNALIFASPKSDIVQSVGRVLRKKHEGGALVWDIIDNVSSFPRQFTHRNRFYKSQKYIIQHYTIDDGPQKSTNWLAVKIREQGEQQEENIQLRNQQNNCLNQNKGCSIILDADDD